VILTQLLAPTTLAGQASAKPAFKTWTPARTPDGQLDLQGVWNNETVTPLERPDEFAGRSVLTPEEATNFEKDILQQAVIRDSVRYSEFWFERGGKVIPSRRTSLIIDPPDGKVPPLTPEAQKRVGEGRRRVQQHPADGPESRTLWERCITRGLPLFPTHSNFQIVQVPGYVIVVQELIHEARIIPLDGRSHVPATVGFYMGDGRGRWEGNTLVIDTTNFTDRYEVRGRDYPLDLLTPSLHLIERFTRIDANTINYQFTVDDPATFTRPWTAEFPMRSIQSPMFDYACHEGNYSMATILAGARNDENRTSEVVARPVSK
jgi:hypothetical protein